MERTWPVVRGNAVRENHYAVRFLERFAPGTAYAEVFSCLAEMFAVPPLSGSTLAVDRTGIGQPVLDLLRRLNPGAQIRPLTITSGLHAGPAPGGGWLVPRTELVGTLVDDTMKAIEDSNPKRGRPGVHLVPLAGHNTRRVE